MPGYQIVEMGNLTPLKEDGIAAYENKIGFLDFLREISQEPLSFPKFHQIQVRGLEEVLFSSRPDDEKMAIRMHKLLRQGAQQLERKLIEVQIVFHGKIIRGDTFWVEYRNAKLPIGHIFGTPLKQKDSNVNPFYKTNFNLTNG